MKKILVLLIGIAFFFSSVEAQQQPIVIQTDNTSLVFKVGNNKRLYQTYLGKRLLDAADYAQLKQGNEAYVTHGMNDYFEPALHINHSDGNSSTLLTYAGHTTHQTTDGATKTIITLVDTVYNDEVKLHYIAYAKENVFKTWAEITNKSKRTVELEKYASAMLHLNSAAYYLTQFNGNWADEVNMTEQKLAFGKKVIDTKLGTRADMMVSPFFQLAIGTPAAEEVGTVMTGTLGWSGNFRFTFEQDENGILRIVSGINPYFSAYKLEKSKTFVTPEFIFTLSYNGTGQASRNLHDWARAYQLKDGDKTRMTLLNNWEATYFSFDEAKLKQLIGEAKELGVDMFLLDDGWFGTKYPRNSDTQGLGDWTEIKDKLPGGIGVLTDEAKRQGIKFGLWIEPEMVNPKSELFEKHPDWAFTLPNRETYYFRNQLVLDLSNPEVQDYVFSIVDNLLTKYPEIAYFKWDCNSPITNIYSHYEGMNQSHLYVDYVRGLYSVLDRVKAKYPNVPMMLCSGGGGRTDYEALKYFTEFWPSDNTDPVERLFIQWGYSQVFPAKAQCAHVTTWNAAAPVKFRTNVAMMGKLGFDIKMGDMSEKDQTYCRQAVKNYNNIKDVIQDGDRYGLVSPYSGPHTATMYITKDKKRAVLFTFDVHPRFSEYIAAVTLRGLDPTMHYTLTEIDRIDGKDKVIGTYSGDYLMTIGLNLFTSTAYTSRVFNIQAQ